MKGRFDIMHYFLVFSRHVPIVLNVCKMFYVLIMWSMIMLDMVLTFLILAIIAALLGFSGVAIISVEIARILFIIFIVLFLFSLIAHLLGYSRTPRP